MKILLSVALILLVLLASPYSHLAADPFPPVNTKLVANKEITLRGVINQITVPVPDDLDLASTQKGYFLITPFPFDAEGEDPFQDGKRVFAKEQIMFHLVFQNDLAETIQKLAEKPVEIVAIPLPAHTRHHRTSFLLDVKSIKALTK